MKIKKISAVLLIVGLLSGLPGGQSVMSADGGMPSDIQKVYVEPGRADTEKTSLLQAEPQATMAPLPVGDYADIYIQAIKTCGYRDAATFGKDFLALDFGARPGLDETEMERIQTYFQELGYTV